MHLLQCFVRTHIVYPTYILLCSVRCNFIEKRFNRIKKPINSAASAVVVIYVSTCRPMHLSGVFFSFYFSRSFHTRTRTPDETPPMRLKPKTTARAISLFFNRSLITMTRYRYILHIFKRIHTRTHIRFLYTYIIIYTDLYYIIINTRPRICAHYNNSHILYNTHEGSLLTTAASAGFPLQERSSMDIYLYYYHFFPSPFMYKLAFSWQRVYNTRTTI